MVLAPQHVLLEVPFYVYMFKSFDAHDISIDSNFGTCFAIFLLSCKYIICDSTVYYNKLDIFAYWKSQL